VLTTALASPLQHRLAGADRLILDIGGAGHATGGADGLLQPLGVLPVGGIASHPINGSPQPGLRRALERHYHPAAAQGHQASHSLPMVAISIATIGTLSGVTPARCGGRHG
jgi:hypothetical protein